MTASRLLTAVLVAVVIAACGTTNRSGSTASSPTASRSSSETPTPQTRAEPHLMVIVEENRGYAATLGSCGSDPYLCSLAAGYASLTAWYGITHPSAPNYLALDSGSTQGVASDCTPDG